MSSPKITIEINSEQFEAILARLTVAEAKAETISGAASGFKSPPPFSKSLATSSGGGGETSRLPRFSRSERFFMSYFIPSEYLGAYRQITQLQDAASMGWSGALMAAVSAIMLMGEVLAVVNSLKKDVEDYRILIAREQGAEKAKAAVEEYLSKNEWRRWFTG